MGRALFRIRLILKVYPNASGGGSPRAPLPCRHAKVKTKRNGDGEAVGLGFGFARRYQP